MNSIPMNDMCTREKGLEQANMEGQTEERTEGRTEGRESELKLPEVEVPSDLEDEFTPEVDDQGQIWWFVDSLVEKKMRYCNIYW
jgi:hypothetical protein